MNYQELFKNNILPKYGQNRDTNLDEQLYNNNNFYNQLSNKINLIREDFLNLDVYTIDPDGCNDADDAFSIQEIDNKLFLIIHIADPTHYIDLNSNLWIDIQQRVLTHYPSNNQPIHMMPDFIIKKSSLNLNHHELKNSISVFFEIDKDTYLPTDNIQIKFTKLKIKEQYNLSYKYASTLDDPIINLGITISQNLKNERSKKTIGTKLSDVNILIPKFNDNKIYYENLDMKTKLMKEMISEVAILTNTFIGNFLKNNMNYGIFRTCKNDIDIDDNIKGIDLLNKIIENGIKADYRNTQEKHDLVGSNIYCHFTSPMRRLADCICHYLIKFYFTNTENIWNQDQLNYLADLCYQKTKKEKNIQYLDTKFRLIQLIDHLLSDNKINIEFKINSYSGLFLNIIINKLIINNKIFDIYISYTIRIKNNFYYSIVKNKYEIEVNQVSPLIKFDQGTIIDLDNFIFSLIN